MELHMSGRTALLYRLALLLCALLSAAVLTAAHWGIWLWIEGSTNGSISGIVFSWLSLLVWCAGVLVLFLLSASLLYARWGPAPSTRALDLTIVAFSWALLVCPWGLAGLRVLGDEPFHDGFDTWARGAVAGDEIRAWIRSSPARTACSAPLWWPTLKQDMPVGDCVDCELPDAIARLAPAEVRLPGDSSVLLAWQGLWFRWMRFVLIGADDVEPPPELLRPNVVWREADPGMWTAFVMFP
jgi:hypothetical protein